MTQLKEILEAYRDNKREFPSYGELMALATAPTPVAVPEGWKLVPESPTLEMLEAANVPRRLNWDSLSIWKAMVEASPETVQGD